MKDNTGRFIDRALILVAVIILSVTFTIVATRISDNAVKLNSPEGGYGFLDGWHYGIAPANTVLLGCWIFEDGSRLYRDFIRDDYGRHEEWVSDTVLGVMELTQPTCWNVVPEPRKP